MPDPFRSPKQSRVAAKSRSHPYARPLNSSRTRDVAVQRSNSLLGALKTIVTAPLAWLSSNEAQESNDTHQKRRISPTERSGTPPRAKRARRETPVVVEEFEAGFADPPSSMFELKRTSIRSFNDSNGLNGVPPARTMSIDRPPPSVEPADLPLPVSRGASIISRTSMSVELLEAPPICRSVTRDLSMPPPSPFARSHSRSSMTPFAPGATFGPSPKRRPRESTAPPLLGSSTPTPTFTRPPATSTGHQNLFSTAASRGWSEGPMSAFLEQNRQSSSPARGTPTRGMLLGDDALVSGSPSIAKAERTLSTLESFRTPLHTSAAAPPYVENRRPRKVHVPNPSKLRFDHTPESKKDKAKRVPDVIGPYSTGMSGMRKLLARRREELEEEAGLDTESKLEKGDLQNASGISGSEADVKETQMDGVVEADMEDDSTLLQGRIHVNGVSPKRDAISPKGSPMRSKGDSYSRLRASSSKVHRSHAPAPKLKKARNKFSLEDEEEEEEWSMSVEELKKYQARTQNHMSFSTTRRMSETGMQTDTSVDDISQISVVSPLLPAQPQTFDSLLSRIGPSTGVASKAIAEFPAEPPKTESEAKAQLELASSSESTAPVKLPFSFGVSTAPSSTPKPVDAISSPFAAPASTTTTIVSSTSPMPAAKEGIVPSFFANTKVQFTPPTVPSGSLFGATPSNGEGEKTAEQPTNLFGTSTTSNKEEKKEAQTPKEPKPSPFGGISKPSVFGGSSASPSGNASTTAASHVSSPFSGLASGQVDGPAEVSQSNSPFGDSNTNGTEAPTPSISIFGAASKSTSEPPATTSDEASKPAFSFNAPPSASVATPSADRPKTPSATPSGDAPPKPPVFSFGAPALSSTETPKSVFTFGTSAQPKASDTEVVKSPFSFGAAPSTPPPAEKKSGFTFNATSNMSAFSSGSGTMNNDVNGTTAEPPKPAFGGFGNVGTLAIPSTPKPSESTVDNNDGMELAADRMEESPTRSVEKKTTSTMQLPQSSPFAAFGSSSGSTPFSFGSDKTTTGGAFTLGQSKPSTTSGFTFGQGTNTSSTVVNTNTGFNFGTNSTKPTGQATSVFGPPLTSTFGSTTLNPTPSSTFSFTQSNTSAAPNPFGQPQQPQENSVMSTPSSPSLFPQPAAQPQSPAPTFSFSLPAGAGPGAFGAAKPDPAVTPTPPTQPFQFGATGTSQQQQPQQASTAATNAPTMFTLGGAATTPRKVKGLPNRRGKRP